MENMRIGIDCRNLEGQRTGVGRYLANLLRHWSNPAGSDPAGLEFVLYFRGEIPADIKGLNRSGSDPARSVGVRPRFSFRLLRGGSNAIFKHWLLPRAAERDKVDILFCPDYVLPIQSRRSIKTAVTMHDIIYEARPDEYSWPSGRDKILLKWASKQSAKRADVIFAPSEFTKSEILKHYKVNTRKVVVTPLAPDPIFKARKDAERYAEKRGNVQIRRSSVSNSAYFSGKYILFVGSIFNRRYLPQKIKGFAEFAKEYSDFKFLIIGKNHTKPFQDIGAFVAEANKILGREAVVWRENASDTELVRFYNCAFATLWLSSYEGFGLPVLESMACGTPVITSPTGSLPEIGGSAALYVAHPEDPAEISKALDNLARNKSCHSDLASAGLARAARFSWQKCAEITFRSLLNLIQ